MTDIQGRIRVAGTQAEIDFGTFDLEGYELFLRCKKLPESRIAYDWRADRYTISTPARFAALLGAQVAIVERERRRAARKRIGQE